MINYKKLNDKSKIIYSENEKAIIKCIKKNILDFEGNEKSPNKKFKIKE